jgi:hypothetical protein
MDMLAPLVKGMQQQQKDWSARENDIDAMKADLLDLQDDLEALARKETVP